METILQPHPVTLSRTLKSAFIARRHLERSSNQINPLSFTLSVPTAGFTKQNSSLTYACSPRPAQFCRKTKASYPNKSPTQLSLCHEGRSRLRSMATASMPENAMPPAIHKLDNIEAAKRRAAYKAVEDHFDTSYRYVGIGSGSTVVYVVEAIAAKGRDVTSKIVFIPTGDQSKQLIIEAGLPLGSIDSLPPVEIEHSKLDGLSALQVATGLQDLGLKGKRQSLDVAFDGADEIDEELNCIKGGGACLFQEKLVATAAKKFICVADSRKLQPRLLTKWKTIPIEIAPFAAPTIKRILITLGSPDPVIRQGGSAKAGPVVTDNGMWIMDAPFPPLLLASDLKHGDHGDGENGTWEVHHLGRRLKRIVGVLEVGLFHGRNGLQVASAGEEGGGQKPVAAYFGMENGEVEVRNAAEVLGSKSRP